MGKSASVVLAGLVAAMSLSASPAHASQVSVSMELTRFTMGQFFSATGTFNNGLMVNGQSVTVCGSDPTCAAALADPSIVNTAISGSSVVFRYDTAKFPTNAPNSFSFVGAQSEVAGPGISFLLGTLTFTNGQFYPLAFVDFTLTTHSTNPALNNHGLSGRIRLDTNSTVSLQPEAEADYFTLQDAAGRTLSSLGSVRVYDSFACPAGTPAGQTCNVGSVDLYGHINSLDLERFANATGGAFINASTTGSLVPEPSTGLLWAAGMGLALWRKRGRATHSG